LASPIRCHSSAPRARRTASAACRLPRLPNTAQTGPSKSSSTWRRSARSWASVTEARDARRCPTGCRTATPPTPSTSSAPDSPPGRRDEPAAATATVLDATRPDGTPLTLRWGPQLDLREITPTAHDAVTDETGKITDSRLAGYIAKYATKGTGKTTRRAHRRGPARRRPHRHPRRRTRHPHPPRHRRHRAPAVGRARSYRAGAERLARHHGSTVASSRFRASQVTAEVLLLVRCSRIRSRPRQGVDDAGQLLRP
jgi:hypothetical protein